MNILHHIIVNGESSSRATKSHKPVAGQLYVCRIIFPGTCRMSRWHKNIVYTSMKNIKITGSSGGLCYEQFYGHNIHSQQGTKLILVRAVSVYSCANTQPLYTAWDSLKLPHCLQDR